MNSEQVSNFKANLLLVDDTPNNLRLLSTMLTEKGYKVRSVINGLMALMACDASPPDLILLDINMPEMNGYEVCQKLKANAKTAEIPVIFISAFDEALDKVKAFQVGGVDYITKPFHIEEVLARIQNQLILSQQKKLLATQNLRLQQEIKERYRAEEEIRLLLRTSKEISKAADFHSAIELVLRLVCQMIGWDFGEAWVPAEDGIVLECSRGWYASDLSLKEFRREREALTFAANCGLPGRIWSSQQVEWIEDISIEQDTVFFGSKVAQVSGLKACFGVPILVNEEVLAVLVLFREIATSQEPHWIELVNAIASQLGSVIQRKRSEDALRIAEQRYHSLVENAIEGIFQSTPSGQFVSANPALAKLYGYASPEALITQVKDISQQVYVEPQRRDEFIRMIETDQAVSGFESLVYRQDKSTIWISENARAVRDLNGNILYYEGTVSDITERRLAEEALRFQQAQTEELLLNILPAAIADRLKRQQSTIADSFEAVSVLFADIVGFTELSARKSPKELVEILNQIFSKFDGLAERHNLEKIKTIGDAYMVVAGLPTPSQDHANAIAQMALDMQTELHKVSHETGERFNIRIGINSGPVVAGVIGIKKFIYDLWGDTVNIASRMESNGIPGKIQVSAATYELLQNHYEFEPRGTIPIKGKGKMMTYFLLGKNSYSA